MAEDACIWTMARTARTNCSCSIKGIYTEIIGSRSTQSICYARAKGRSKYGMGVNRDKLSRRLCHCWGWVVLSHRLYHLFQLVPPHSCIHIACKKSFRCLPLTWSTAGGHVLFCISLPWTLGKECLAMCIVSPVHLVAFVLSSLILNLLCSLIPRAKKVYLNNFSPLHELESTTEKERKDA